MTTTAIIISSCHMTRCLGLPSCRKWVTHTCLNITSNHFSHAVSRHKHPKKWLLFSGIPAVKSQLLCLSWLFRLESYTHYVLVALVSMSVSQCVKSQEYSAVELHCGNPKLVWLSQVRIDGTIRNSVALASVAFPGKPLYSECMPQPR